MRKLAVNDLSLSFPISRSLYVGIGLMACAWGARFGFLSGLYVTFSMGHPSFRGTLNGVFDEICVCIDIGIRYLIPGYINSVQMDHPRTQRTQQKMQR
jgi:hypothetical protein